MDSPDQVLHMGDNEVLEAGEHWLRELIAAQSHEVQAAQLADPTNNPDEDHSDAQNSPADKQSTFQGTNQVIEDWRQICKVAPVAGRGLGIIATCKIPAGTCIAVEKPLLLVHDREKHPFISTVEAFKKLTLEEKREYLKLFVSPETIERVTKDALNRRRIELDEGAAFVSGIETNNAWGLSNDRSIVLQLGSRFNHSCLPNVEVSSREYDLTSSYRNVTDLDVGDELTVSYIGSDVMELKPQRDEMLRHWGFVCACPGCEEHPTNQVREKVKAIRKRLLLMAKTALDLETSRRATLLLMKLHEEMHVYDEQYIAYACTLAEHDLLKVHRPVT